MAARAALLAGLIAVTAGCGRSVESPPDAGTPPNFLIVVLDACRYDKLGCNGFPRAATPAIDTLAAEPDTVQYRRHYVQGAYTKPSTASLFTGRYVFEHGVCWGHTIETNLQRPRFVAGQALDERFDTMAERFAALGYFTFGVVKSVHLHDIYGFAQGFDEYFPPTRTEDDHHRLAVTMSLARQARRPFFGYLHLSACHHPFPHEDRDAAYMERYAIDYDEPARQARGIDFTSHQIMHDIEAGRASLTPADVEFLHLVYEAELRRVDRELVAPLLEQLRDARLFDNTLLVVTADHGEQLYDHGGYAHGDELWEEIVHVPLLVKFPRGRKPAGLPREVDGVTQSVDLLPSMLALLGVQTEADLPGTDIFQGTPRGVAYCETPDAWALVHGDHKMIRGDHGGLFDLAVDPGEQVDLSGRRERLARSMETKAAALRELLAAGRRDAPTVEAELDQASLEALRSLGYLR